MIYLSGNNQNKQYDVIKLMDKLSCKNYIYHIIMKKYSEKNLYSIIKSLEIFLSNLLMALISFL